MRGKTMKRLALTLSALLAVLAGCAAQPAKLPAGAAQNDILTFIPNPEDRPIIRVGTQYYTPDTSLIDALQSRFPDYLFVLDYGPAAGVNAENHIMEQLERGPHYDMLISGNLNGIVDMSPDLLVDLSAESFLNDYLVSSLNDVNIDGHIYTIPGTSTLSGIAFNVDMFEEHGWQIPGSIDEFFALCAQIEAAGVTPFSTNCKYIGQLNRLLTSMCYTELFGTKEGAVWLTAVQRNQADFTGYLEPLFALAKRFADTGVIRIDDFTASLTKQRQAFWAGEYAMIDYDSVIYTYAESENAPFALGIMPYPAANAADAGFAVTPEYYISIPRYVEDDPARLAFIKEVLAFISTQEGQEAMLADSLRVSNVKGVDLSGNPAAKYAEEAYERGNLYPLVLYNKSVEVPFLTLQQTAVQSLLEGASVADAVAYMDSEVGKAFAQGVEVKEYTPIATAEQAFTMLETSYYIADKFREVTGADIALMINGGFFRSNLAAIEQGEITDDMSYYVMKGVGAEDYLTTYTLSGAQLKALIEHPIVNGEEIDALIAASGLKMQYAPWNGRGSRVLALTRADGAALADDELYTVAAWAGVIDAQYITETIQTYEALGSITDILSAAFSQDGTIKPDIAGRLTLVWPTVQ